MKCFFIIVSSKIGKPSGPMINPFLCASLRSHMCDGSPTSYIILYQIKHSAGLLASRFHSKGKHIIDYTTETIIFCHSSFSVPETKQMIMNDRTLKTNTIKKYTKARLSLG